MFGLRTPFHYAQCATCGSLWLTDPPSDLGLTTRALLQSHGRTWQERRSELKKYLLARRDEAYFGGRGILGHFMALRYKTARFFPFRNLV